MYSSNRQRRILIAFWIYSQSSARKETTTTKKKAAAKAKNQSNGVWPCEMNGCNKQFAREADLKRHQRTTKLHSIAGFACPQCEANFTRTDALRRHQKSRHNDSVCDPMETEDSGEHPPNGSAVISTSKENGRDAVVPETIQGTPSATGPATGHSSYYRESTTTGSYASPPRTVFGTEYEHALVFIRDNTEFLFQDGLMEILHIPSVKQPTCTSSSPSTSSSHSHQNDAEEPASPFLLSYKSASILAPIPPLPPPVQLLEPLLVDADATQVTRSSSSEPPCSQEGYSHNPLMKHARTWSMSDEADMSGGESSLFSSTSTSSSSSSVASSGSPSTSKGSHIMREHGYGSRLIRPEPLEPIMTENGEPMLDPAELLTQVGWVALYDGSDSLSDDVRPTSSHESLSPAPS
ncbi:hypothetical protein C8R41DRAFT_392758 [Lentinula lateritia]|uniref:C2H2-type domain-containing protein n=1 Tax=Lentinula lateritia TaxID=40482 RepID=A0ABQ8VDN6_9AGAR|nr:hypothetical protein C8R41DRAFT_392758 [Lentinula lateritia]